MRSLRLPWFLLCAFCALQMALLIGLSTSALGQRSDQVYNSLAKSRDALLDQRTYLQAEADKLQRQLDTVNSYLRDNDRALRDVETAMKRN
ncbi:MAG: hypothetical protein IPP57_09865 [Candidatus Obscuribacter sp.]|jgi:hypothetical protein|nr:hypothetical protein [Candidatus Obscuribacter sp.]MBK9206350.1 hypothetical protein [Candidatus Obscuribacter sp.]MBK9618251.1 hypothetical protein [Candidatus Obscuribacter sp.]MBK9771116.1 hypothetical protein [Candidatus Obscuribacter sp.]MDQ5964231.1 hypothetical protein [Cyanobacteriota bacterium erpe_2018_sw_39hr_WHONDRS-SW48-000098_B_bin.30]